jgi:hypothetical protein
MRRQDGVREMNEFEAKVLADLSVLKNQMSSLIGGAQPGRLAVLEKRVENHEASLQRVKGFVGAFGILFTIAHLAFEWFRRI